MADNTLAGKIADYALGLRFASLPDDVVHEAKRRVIDSFACAFGAFESPAVRAALESAPAAAGGLCSGIILSDKITAPDYAAFVNGVMIRFLDYNDTYLSKEPAHPSDNMSAVLSAAEAAGRGGEEFITALVAAYEVQCRLCDAASLRARGFDHVTYGVFSAAASAGRLFGLTRSEAEHALGMAGAGSIALRQTRSGGLSMWKGAAFANAARNAVFAVMLAKNGMTGPAPLFEGEFGFFRLISGQFDVPRFAPQGGAGFKILDTYIKYYPAEYHAQSAIAAAAELSCDIGGIDEIDAVEVRTFGAAYEIIGSGREKWRPLTRESADHSLPFCVASALMDGGVNLDTFSSEKLANARLIALMDKITVVKDEGFEKMYPQAMPSLVEVRLKSGSVLSKELIYPKGHPKDRMTDKEVEDKFRRLSAWYFTEEEAGRVLERLWAVDRAKDMKEVTALFKGRGGARGKGA